MNEKTAGNRQYLSLTSGWTRALALGAGLLIVVVLVWNYGFGPSTISPDLGHAYDQLSAAGLTAALVGGSVWLICAVLLALAGVLVLNLLAPALPARMMLTARLLIIATVVGVVGFTAFVPHALMSVAVGHAVNLDEIVYRDPVSYFVFVAGGVALLLAVIAGMLWVAVYLATARERRALLRAA